MCGGGGDGGAKEARRREEQRQQRIREGTNLLNEQFSRYDNTFYDQRSDAYLDYAKPQLQRQFGDVYTKLVSALSRGGILQSSVGARKLGDLQRDYDLQKQALIDTGLDYANQARRNIEDTRSSLIMDLQASADPAAAQQAALARAQVLSAMPKFSPLGDLFTNVTAGIADYETAAQNRALRQRYGLSEVDSPLRGGSQRIFGGG